LSACGVLQITEEWGELNPNWHLEAFGAFYTPFWAAYAKYEKILFFQLKYCQNQGGENVV
jgi:hypothetical protein